ncbi:MAG TPA: VWA domain-containing protein [Oscillatoriaceae cyanobacterium]
MSWANPELLGLLVLVPLLALLAWALRRFRRGLPLSTLRIVRGLQSPLARWATTGLFALRLGAIALIVVALARPQWGRVWEEQTQRGVDIMLALDLSGSMRAEDFQPQNRLVAAKQVIDDFIQKTPGNRIGLVVFAGRANTLVPLTTDHEMLRDTLRRVDFDTVSQDGTAIGDAIGTCLYRLHEPNIKGRVIILFTDGENNSGYLDPIKAAEMARVEGVRIHTIAVGRPGGAPIPILNAFGQKVYLRDADGALVLPQIAEKPLQEIAAITGGRYYRATDVQALRQIYDEINHMEKSPYEVKRHVIYEERYQPYLILGLLLLLVEFLLSRRFAVLEAA